VVLLRILLELQHELNPGYILYEQGVDDPSERADAILTIGDLAITKPETPGFSYRYDLGDLWHRFTGLPFVFALWQVNYKKAIERDLSTLYDILITSKLYGISHLPELSREYSDRFHIPADVLLVYWNLFSYNFADEERKGLLAYYGYAAEIGAIEPVTDLRFWMKS
jgi:chorismate dehydratase